MASEPPTVRGTPDRTRAAHGDRLRLVPTELAYVEPRARCLRPYPGWGILMIGSEEKTVIRGRGDIVVLDRSVLAQFSYEGLAPTLLDQPVAAVVLEAPVQVGRTVARNRQLEAAVNLVSPKPTGVRERHLSPPLNSLPRRLARNSVARVADPAAVR